MIRSISLLALSAVMLTAGLAQAGPVAVGQAAPDFKVESGDEKPLALADLKGKVAVVFYETRDQVEINRPLKKALNSFYENRPQTGQNLVARVPVVDCSSASWPFTGFWRDGLMDASKKEGMTIYGDWDGKMRADYKLPDEQPSFMVLGPGGVVLFFASGQIGPERFKQIKGIIAQATMQAAGN